MLTAIWGMVSLEMAKDMKPMTPKEIAKYKAMAQYQNTGTMTNYIMEPCEIGAREAETKLLESKKEAVESSKQSEKAYQEVMAAIRSYSGNPIEEDEYE